MSTVYISLFVCRRKTSKKKINLLKLNRLNEQDADPTLNLLVCPKPKAQACRR